MEKQWELTQDGENYTVKVCYTHILGKMSVTLNGETYDLPNKFLAGIFGRKENFILGDKLASVRLVPFGGIELTTAAGKF
jgi:hypothetical protein